MRSPFRILTILLAVAGALSAQSTVVLNAASPTIPDLFANLPPGGYLTEEEWVTNTISPGMVATLYATATSISIRPSGSNTTIPVDIIGPDSNGVAFEVPRNMPLGGAEIEYKAEGQPTAWTNVNVVAAASFDFFRLGTGGPAIAQAVAANGSLSQIGLTTPAQTGQVVLLTGSGPGYDTPFTITVGGIAAPIVQAPAHRAQLGPEQIMIQIPAGVVDGCYVPLALTYNNTTVNATISKTSGGAPCVHPFQLSLADMKLLDSGGSLTVAEVDLSTVLKVATPFAASRVETATANETAMTAAGIGAYFAPGPSAAVCQPGAQSVGGFFGVAFAGLIPIPPPPPGLGSSMVLQNGASVLPLTQSIFPTDPGGYGASIPQGPDGPLTNPPAPAIPGGNWIWQFMGGAALGPTSFAFTLPMPFQLNGITQVVMARNQEQTLTWNGAAFGSGTTIRLLLPGGGSCSVPASTGTLTIPASVLTTVPANLVSEISITLTEAGSLIPHAQFKLQDGTTLLTVIRYSTGETLPVDFQ